MQRKIVAAFLITATLGAAAVVASDLKHGLLTTLFVLIAIAVVQESDGVMRD